MKYNCGYCKKYWEFLSEPYFSDLKHKSQEATKDMTLFCPACRVPEVRKKRWENRKK